MGKTTIFVVLVAIIPLLVLPIAAAGIPGTCYGIATGSGTHSDPFKCTGMHTGNTWTYCIGNYEYANNTQECSGVNGDD